MQGSTQALRLGALRARDERLPACEMWPSIGRYVVIKPDFLECITNSGFLWFENEYTVDAAVLEANAASAIVNERHGLSLL